MVKLLSRKIAEFFAPDATRRYLEARWLHQSAKEFNEKILSLESIEDRVDFAREFDQLRSNQKRSEIIALLETMESTKPVRVCEIGSDRGGTLALFASAASPNAQILSLDINFPGPRVRVYETLCREGQSITCIESDSHTQDALEQVNQWLAGEPLDFLFIDGDHSYDGVKADYEMYAPLVRPGGIIAFHDIVPDFFTRYGTKTGSDVGEVPRFWSELKPTLDSCKEFIEDPDQDGYGIGMIHAIENSR